MKKCKNTLILNSSWELIVYIISVLSIFRAPSLHSRTNWEHRKIRRVERSRRGTPLSKADLSRRKSSALGKLHGPLSDGRRILFYTVKTLSSVRSGVTRMWRQRGESLLKISRNTCPRWVITSHPPHPGSSHRPRPQSLSILLLSSAPPAGLNPTPHPPSGHTAPFSSLSSQSSWRQITKVRQIPSRVTSNSKHMTSKGKPSSRENRMVSDSSRMARLRDIHCN